MNQTIHGLTDNQIKNNRQLYGQNILPETPPPSSTSLVISQIKSPLVYVLIIASLVTFLIGHTNDSIIILVAVSINTLLGYIQEKKATSALSALKSYLVSQVSVLRSGQREIVGISELLPGDIVYLTQGTKVPADGKLIEANRVYFNEALLTGESIPVSKTENNQVFMGTTVSSGQAIMQVEKIGAKTQMGSIALQIQKHEPQTPLQKQLSYFSKQLLLVILVLVTFVFIIGLFYQYSLIEMFTTSVALAVSSIPEGLVISLTVVLAVGMQRILKRRGLVKKLSAAETLGGVSVICVDKTGTLTEGKMKIVDIFGNRSDIARQVVLANDLDDPIVITAYEWGKTQTSKQLSEKHPKIDSIPFSSKEKYFISMHKWNLQKNIIFVNGAPDVLLSWSTMSRQKRKSVISQIDELTKQGKRVIGFAKKEVSSNKQKLTPQDAKGGLTWVGLIAFSDPVRVGVKEALSLAQKAGIRTVVITGDYAKTSQFVMSELGIRPDEHQILTGDQIKQMTKDKFLSIVHNVTLFARTNPDQKLLIVNALKQKGDVVAMMGDGVNDAPALHDADIGIAVGEATDVAKESADLILLDSNFSTIVSAIEEGRSMFENIRKVILYLMCDAFVEIFVVIVGIILGLPLPITAVQILWINLVSDGLPSLALTIDPKSPTIMEGKSRHGREKLVTSWMVSLVGFVSFVAGLATFLVFYFVYVTTRDVILAQSAAFLVLGVKSLVYVFSIRSFSQPFWKIKFFENKWLVVAVVIGFVLQWLPFSTPSFRKFFGLTNLDVFYWLLAIALAATIFFVVEIFKYFYSRSLSAYETQFTSNNKKMSS